METWEERQYSLKLWFAYRYLYKRPYLLCKSERYRLFFQKLDDRFMQKYISDTEEKTRNNVEQLFIYESERLMIMNEDVINSLIDEYEMN